MTWARVRGSRKRTDSIWSHSRLDVLSSARENDVSTNFAANGKDRLREASSNWKQECSVDDFDSKAEPISCLHNWVENTAVFIETALSAANPACNTKSLWKKKPGLNLWCHSVRALHYGVNPSFVNSTSLIFINNSSRRVVPEAREELKLFLSSGFEVAIIRSTIREPGTFNSIPQNIATWLAYTR